MSGLVLSLFPGIGMLDHAFELEGFCVVRGPDPIWGGDIRTFHPPAGRFDGVIGGPPCQAFSQLRHMVEANGYELAPNLIPEFERVVEAARPDWFVMENVKAAPIPVVRGYDVTDVLLRDVWVGGTTSRLRRFSFGSQDGRRFPIRVEALHSQQPELAVTSAASPVPVKQLSDGSRKKNADMARRSVPEMLEAQGFPGNLLDKCPLTVTGQRLVVGNGVPLAMGRTVALAVREAL